MPAPEAVEGEEATVRFVDILAGMSLLDVKAIVRASGGLVALMDSMVGESEMASTLAIFELDDLWNLAAFATNLARFYVKYGGDPESEMYTILGYGVQGTTAAEVVLDYSEALFDDATQSTITTFGNPISMVLGEFYPDVVGDVSKYLSSFWYGYSEGYWYYFAMAIIGDIDTLFTT